MPRHEKQREELPEGKREEKSDLQKAREAYKQRRADFLAKMIHYQLEKTPGLHSIAEQYEERVKKELLDPEEVAHLLDTVAIREQQQAMEHLIEQWQQEPAFRYRTAVKFHREWLQKAIKEFPGEEELFTGYLKEFEAKVKRMKTPMTHEAAEAAELELSSYMQDPKYTEAYNREYAYNLLTKSLGSRVKETMKKVLSTDDVDKINARLEREFKKDLKRMLDDEEKPKGTIPDEWVFQTKGLFIRIGNDASVAVIGASEKAKEKNSYLAVLPTMGDEVGGAVVKKAEQKEKVAESSKKEGTPLEEATPWEKQRANDKHVQALKFYNAGDYKSALPYFEASYRIVKSPNSHYLIVSCLTELGQTEQALEEAKVLLPEAEKAVTINPERYKMTRDEARLRLAELEEAVATERSSNEGDTRTARN